MQFSLEPENSLKVLAIDRDGKVSVLPGVIPPISTEEVPPGCVGCTGGSPSYTWKKPVGSGAIAIEGCSRYDEYVATCSKVGIGYSFDGDWQLPRYSLDVRGTTYSGKMIVGEHQSSYTPGYNFYVSGNSRFMGETRTDALVSMNDGAVIESSDKTSLTINDNDSGPWGYALDVRVSHDDTKALVIHNQSHTEPQQTPPFIVYGDGSTEIGQVTSQENSSTMLTVHGKIIAEVNHPGTNAFVVRGPVPQNNYYSEQFPPGTENGMRDNFIIDSRGHVSIGVNGGRDESLLAVGGLISSRAFKIRPSNVNLPDYVFYSDYILPSLDSVKAFVDDNCHLPGVSSAEEVEKNGLDVHLMQVQQLEQVERLYLYIIDLEDRMKQLEEQLKTSKTKSH